LGYVFAADSMGIYIRLAVVASQKCEAAQNSAKIWTYSSSSLQGHRFWYQL